MIPEEIARALKGSLARVLGIGRKMKEGPRPSSCL